MQSAKYNSEPGRLRGAKLIQNDSFSYFFLNNTLRVYTTPFQNPQGM